VEGSAETVSARKISEVHLFRKSISQKLHWKILAYTIAKILQRTTSLDVLAEPKYYSKCMQTSSTRVFASHMQNMEVAVQAPHFTPCLLKSASNLYTTGFPIHWDKNSRATGPSPVMQT
jgi:hypothetical protein